MGLAFFNKLGIPVTYAEEQKRIKEIQENLK